MAIRNALPFEFPFHWNALRRFFSELDIEAIDYLDQRDRDLEDFLAGILSPLIIDVGDGAAPTGHTKGHWIGQSRILNQVTGTLSIPGSTDTIANVLRDDTTVGTVTIPAGDRIASAMVGAHFPADSFWQMQQTSTGTGAGGLTWFGEFR